MYDVRTYNIVIRDFTNFWALFSLAADIISLCETMAKKSAETKKWTKEKSNRQNGLKKGLNLNGLLDCASFE